MSQARCAKRKPLSQGFGQSGASHGLHRPQLAEAGLHQSTGSTSHGIPFLSFLFYTSLVPEVARLVSAGFHGFQKLWDFLLLLLFLFWKSLVPEVARLETVAKSRLGGVLQEQILRFLAVVDARHFRRLPQVAHEPKRVHVPLQRGRTKTKKTATIKPF